MDVAELGIRVDASGAITVLDKFGHKVDEVAGKTSKLEEMLKKAAEAFAVMELGHKLVDETVKAQNAMARLSAAVSATGGSAGRTKGELVDLAEQIQHTTIYSHDAAEGAEAMLVSFNNISGKNFARVTQDAADLATFLQTDLTSAAEMVGRALQDPANATTMLQRSLRLFSQDQIKNIKLLAETGDTAGAQAIILKALEGRYAGLAAAMRGTLGGALANLKNNFNDLFQFTEPQTKVLVAGINLLASAFAAIKPHMTQIISIVGAALAAWVAYRAVLISVAIYHAIIASAQTIAAFIQLAATVRDLAAAMALVEIAGGTVIKLVALLVAAIGGWAVYRTIMKDINAETKKFNDNPPKPDNASGTLDVARATDMAEELRKIGEAAGAEYEIAEAQLKNFGQQATAIDKLKNAQAEYNAQKEIEARLAKGEITSAEATNLAKANRLATKLNDSAVDTLHLAEQVKKVWEEASNGISDAFTNLFSDMFTKGIQSATDFVNAVKQLFFHMIGELLAHQAMQKLFQLVAGDKGAQALGAQQLTAAAVMLNAANIQAAAAATMASASGVPVTPAQSAGAAAGASGSMAKFGGYGLIGAAGFGAGYGVSSSIGGTKGVLGGTLSGAATGAMIGSVIPVIGTAVGAVIGGVTGFVGSLFGAGAAAKRHAAEIKQVQKAYEDFTDNLKVQLGLMTSTDQQIKQLQDAAAEQIKAQETAKGRPYNDASVAAIAQINNLTKQEIQALKDAQALSLKLTTEDIEARRLRALGNDFEASALELKIQHEREYAQAVKDGLDATTLAQLKYVQSLEEQKAAADAFTSSALNVPEGYKVATALFDALDPEKPGTDPLGGPFNNPTPGGTDNPTMPFPTRGGSDSNGGISPDTPINISLDGKTIASSTIGILQRAATRQYGDATRIFDVTEV